MPGDEPGIHPFQKMGNTKYTAASLQEQLNAAPADVDLKAFAQLCISVLAEAEEGITALQAAAQKASTNIAELTEAKELFDSQLQEALSREDKANEELTTSQALVEELSKKLTMLEKSQYLPGRLVEFKGASKMLLGGRFRKGGKDYSADDVANNKDGILEHLFAKKSGSLVDIPAESN